MKQPVRPAHPALGVFKIGSLLAVVSLGIWGCSKPNPTTSQDRIRSLESRCVQLEQDYRTVAQARDRARKDLTQAQEQIVTQRDLLAELADAQGKLKAAITDGNLLRMSLATRTRERDDLRAQISMRMSEREVLLGRCDKLRKGIQSLLSQDEPAGEGTPASGSE